MPTRKKSQRPLKFRRRRNLLDAWSMPHFLFGNVTAMVAVVMGAPFVVMFTMTLLLAILWEFFEMYVKLRETFWNTMTDILLPLIACTLTFFFVGQASFTHDHRVTLLVVSLLIYGATNVIAWQARINGDKSFMS